jgi:hypothetical protein
VIPTPLGMAEDASREQIAGIPIKPLGPQMRVSSGVD